MAALCCIYLSRQFVIVRPSFIVEFDKVEYPFYSLG